MFAVVDRTGRVIAAFRHWSDAVVYLGQNERHRYAIADVPGLELDELLRISSCAQPPQDTPAR